MTCCIIKLPRLSPNENLNISGLFDFILFFCVSAVVVIIIAISPSLNSKIDLKKKRIAFSEDRKKKKTKTLGCVWSAYLYIH